MSTVRRRVYDPTVPLSPLTRAFMSNLRLPRTLRSSAQRPTCSDNTIRFHWAPKNVLSEEIQQILFGIVNIDANLR
jgi:hypothetical protein